MTDSARLGLYLHIPFCLGKCLYCDFCSFPERRCQMEAYCRELCRRLAATADRCRGRQVDSVYFGGGTPTLLPISCFEEIFSCLHEHYSLCDDCEITCECNPATANLSYLKELRHLGVNRLSIGLQSAHDHELKALGRRHSYPDFVMAFQDARNAGFQNISVDVMYAIPEQTLVSFRETLQRVTELAPEHISAYGLKIEEGTPFFSMRDSLCLPDEDEEFAMYTLCTDFLGQNGYAKYEISNFAKEGRKSRHNLRYWLGEEYLGFGVAAYSFYQGERYGNTRDIDAFLRGDDIVGERIKVREKDWQNEYVMLRMRLCEGIDTEEFARLTGKDFFGCYPGVPAYLQGGFLVRTGNRISFSDRGFFVSNTILSEMLDFS